MAKQRSKSISFLAIAAGISGWIWLASIPFSLWFLTTALFSDAPWSRFLWAFGLGFVGKNLLRGFEANKNRVALEAKLTSEGMPADQARELSFAIMNGDRSAASGALEQSHVSGSTTTDGWPGKEQERERFWRERCAEPPTMCFTAARANLSPSEAEEVAQKLQPVVQVFQRIVAREGPERAECERRRCAAFLSHNYQAEISGDFSGSTPKARDTALTLLATGLAIESLLRSSGRADLLTRRFPADERSPLAS